VKSEYKSDADSIVRCLEANKKLPWLTAYQKKWVDRLFHFTDISNAVKILKDGKLLSRSMLENSDNGFTDIASPGVIASTVPEWKKYVRLYFRPKTPTQYCNEGIRPEANRSLNSHCPMPIFFIFDAKEILTKVKTKFSNGNLGSHFTEVDETAIFLKSLPFEKIYHDSWMSNDKKSSIVFHRNAEVLVPKFMDLSNLLAIYCRSQAEFETFIHLLPSNIRRKLRGKIGVSTGNRLFFKQWTYVERASISSSEISFSFNPSSTISKPFTAKLEILEEETKDKYIWQDNSFYADKKISFGNSLKYPNKYTISLSLDNCIAYKNRYNKKDETLN